MASDLYAPFIGGAERQVELLSKELVLRGHEISLATIWHAGLHMYEDDEGVSIHRLKGMTTVVPWFSTNPGRRFHPPFPDPSIVWQLRQLIRRVRPAVVHAQGWITYSCAAALLRTNIPLVISVRDYGYSCAIRTLLHHGEICDGPAPAKCLECAAGPYGRLKALAAVSGVLGGRELLNRKVSIAVSVSSFVQKITERDLRGHRGSRSRMGCITVPDIVVRPASEATASSKVEHRYFDCLPVEPYILFVGALQPHKGLTELLMAYERLVAPPPLVLIGTVGPDTPREFPSSITVLNDVPHPVVMAAWERALFGVAPSVWPDPLPGVVREAMSKGKAVIATAVGGNTDMIESGQSGLLVPPGDVDALKDAMMRLIQDVKLRDRIGIVGKQSVNRYTADAIVPQFEEIYHRLVSVSSGANG